MKLFNTFLIIVVCFITACNNGNSKEVSSQDVLNSKSANGNDNYNLMPTITFEKDTHNFGKITQGEKVIYDFKFKNTGKSNLIIVSASASCGCTVPEYPTKPILPNEEGIITVVFSSEGKSGVVEKSVSVVTNCEPSIKQIFIKAHIIVPNKANPNIISTTKNQ